MDIENRFDLSLCHLGKTSVTENARVIHQNIDTAKIIERCLDDRLPALRRGDRIVVGDPCPSGRFNLFHDQIRRSLTRPRSINTAAQIIHDDLGTPSSKLKSVALPQTAARSCHNANSVVESDVIHSLNPLLRLIFNPDHPLRSGMDPGRP